MLKTAPAVFAVDNEYQIMVPVERECLFWVRVGTEEFYDESNGILRSLSLLHRAHVPMELLDQEKAYTVCVRPLIERKPYYSETEPVQEFTFLFKPLPETDIRIYHIADTHNYVRHPVTAAAAFGGVDLLILNGDVIDDSGNPEKFINVYQICDQITHGQVPVVFSRGNHDMRGNYAEAFAEYTPNHNGNTYYTFRLGALWGVVLDCGEDKADHSIEYGHTVYCHDFRRRQTAFLQALAGQDDYKQAKYRIVVAHNPFTKRAEEDIFQIEEDVFTQWAELLKVVEPTLMLTGHYHRLRILPIGGEEDDFGQPCPVVIGADRKQDYWAGCGITLTDTVTVTFTDSEGQTLSKHTI